MKWPMRALAMTGMLTAAWIPAIISGSDIRATPPSRRISAGTRSSAMTAAAPASSATFACSGVTTSMITPPLSISASPALTVNVASSRGCLSLSLIGTEFSDRVACGAMSAEAVFLPVGDTTFLATELARGPWDPAAQHGGAPAALLMRAFERLRTSDELVLARVTYEFLRSVPLGELDVRSSVLRSGRRVQLLEGTIRTPDGIEIVRARALRVHRVDPSALATPSAPPPPGPDQGHEHETGAEGFSPPYR